MATSLSIGRLATIFRGKITLMNELSETFMPALTRNKNRLMELAREKVEVAANSELGRKMKVLKGFYTVEMSPPNQNDIQKLQADIKLMQEFIKAKCFLYITVKQAFLLFLVCLEIFLWFFIGETIGKFHFVGYKV